MCCFSCTDLDLCSRSQRCENAQLGGLVDLFPFVFVCGHKLFNKSELIFYGANKSNEIHYFICL